MKTINQINGRLSKSQSIALYNSLSGDRDNWRNRYFTFNLRSGSKTRLSISGNFIFGAAQNEFYQIIGSKGYDYQRDKKSMEIDYSFCGSVLRFKISVSQDMNGVFLSLSTNFKAMEDRYRENTPFLATYSHKVRSNSTFAGFDIKEYFERVILGKYLFAPGKFRNIQIMNNCTKSEALKWWKEYKNRPFDKDIDIESVLQKRIKRKLNIEVKDSFSEKFLLNFLNTNERQKTRKPLFKHPSIWELSDQYCSEFDEDGHEEEFLNGIYSDYPKEAIFA